jgi:hypothetical protein
MEEQVAKFEGWAVVEMFGHQKEIGYVSTRYFGTACLFQIDVPALQEREFILEAPSYVDTEGTTSSGVDVRRLWCPAGSKVKRRATPGRSPLIGPNSIYKLTPCTEDTAMRAIEEFAPRPLMLLELPNAPQLAVTWPDRGEKEDLDLSEEGNI